MNKKANFHVRIPEHSGVSISEYERNVAAVLDVAAFAYALETESQTFKLRGLPAEKVRVVSGNYGSPFELIIEFLSTPPATIATVAGSLLAVTKLVEKAVNIRSAWHGGTVTKYEAKAQEITSNQRLVTVSELVPMTAEESSASSRSTNASFEERLELIEQAALGLDEPYLTSVQGILEQAREDNEAGRKTKPVRVVEALHHLADKEAAIIKPPTIEAEKAPK